MALTQKSSLKKALSQADNIDPAGLSPFVALHLRGLDHIHIHRTSAVGFVETLNAPSFQDPGWVFVSHGHLQSCLKCIESEEVEVSVLSHGGVSVRSVNSVFETELRVHTVDRSRSGMKVHNPGNQFITLSSEWLSGFDIRPFKVAASPVVHMDKLLILTMSGIVVWTTTYDPSVPSSPRESFLKTISGMTQGVLELTENGFYKAVVDGMHVCTLASRSAFPLKDTALADSAPGGVDLPGRRLVQALASALTQVAPNATILLSPKSGVTTIDIYGNPSRFSLGDIPTFNPIHLTPGTAEMLVGALSQTPDEIATLSQPIGRNDWFRITRGICSVSFRIP